MVRYHRLSSAICVDCVRLQWVLESQLAVSVGFQCSWASHVKRFSSMLQGFGTILPRSFTFPGWSRHIVSITLCSVGVDFRRPWTWT